MKSCEAIYAEFMFGVVRCGEESIETIVDEDGEDRELCVDHFRLYQENWAEAINRSKAAHPAGKGLVDTL